MAQKGAIQGRQWEPKRTEVIWKTRKDEVKAKINELQKVDSTKAFLALRQTVLSTMLAGMSREELVALDAEVKKIGREGNSEEDRRR
jgi:hypothetical protein